jgi:hypothetical protein
VVKCESKFEQINYIHLNLLKGKKLGSDETGSAKYYQLGSIFNELMELSPKGMEDRLKKSFLYSNSDELRKYKGPWFMPAYLCGLGLKTNVFSDRERMTSSALKLAYSKGTAIPKLPVDKVWETYDMFSREARLTHPLVTSYPYEGCEDELPISLLVVREWLLSTAEGLQTKFGHFGQMAHRTMEKNLRLWQRHNSKYMRKDRDIEYEHKPSILPIVGIGERG